MFVNPDNLIELDGEEKVLISDLDKIISVLNVPDEFDWGTPQLEDIIFDQFVKRKKIIIQEFE